MDTFFSGRSDPDPIFSRRSGPDPVFFSRRSDPVPDPSKTAQIRNPALYNIKLHAAHRQSPTGFSCDHTLHQ